MPGEPLEVAAAREAREETGLEVRIIRHLGEVIWPGDGRIFEIHDFLAERVSGELAAGDDAAAVGWFSTEEIANLKLTKDLLTYLIRYGVYA